MSNNSLLTYGGSIFSVEQAYYSPSVTILYPTAGEQPITALYCFIGKTDPWPDDNNPPEPEQSQKYIKQTLKNMIAAQKIYSSDISPVISRRDWSANTIYDFYRDDINMFETDENGIQIYNYYVRNKYDQVFKCLWNGANNTSAVEPIFEPGTYSANNVFYGTDGYKWKYIYTLDTKDKLKFFDDEWMPVGVGFNNPNPLLSPAGFGNIDVINVTNGGSNYDTTNASIFITIDGDGVGFNAFPILSNTTTGSITDIIVSNGGTNYTYANVMITSNIGSNATAFSPVSPIGGHGYDPINDFGCNHYMITAQFDGTQSELVAPRLPAYNSFRQIGLLVNPTTNESPSMLANGDFYRTTTDIIVSNNIDNYVNGEWVYQGPSLANSTFSAVIFNFDTQTNVLNTVNSEGQIKTGQPLIGNTSGTTRQVLSLSVPNFSTLSGYVMYVENVSEVRRSTDGIEQFKVVLGF